MRPRPVIAAFAVAVASLATAALAAPAQANPPCHASVGRLFCGNKAPTKVYAKPTFGSEDSRGGFHPTAAVDTLKTNPSTFRCYTRGETHPGGNNIWYYTNGDETGRFGYVPASEVFTQKDPFPGVNSCSAPAPPTPTPPQGTGRLSPAQPQGTGRLSRAQPQGTGRLSRAQPQPPGSPDYEFAMSWGFRKNPPRGATRVIVNTGAVSGDDGVIMMRWFIPAGLAAEALLAGDDRRFSDDPRAASDSRMVLVWDVATGMVSLTVQPSTLLIPDTQVGIGLPPREPTRQLVSALPIHQRDSCQGVKSADFQTRRTNDFFIKPAKRGIDFCISGLNSVTTVSRFGALSADGEGQLIPRSATGAAGGYDVSFDGNGYPAIEANYYPRTQNGSHRLFRRKIDPFVTNAEPSGGVAALDGKSWWKCTRDASTEELGSVCRNELSGKNRSYTTRWSDSPGPGIR